MTEAPAEFRVALPKSEIFLILAGLLMAMLLAALDQTIVATAMPSIARELGDPEHLPWIVTSYLLTATASIPIYGKLGDIHGRRIVLMAGISIFIAGSILCALSRTMLLLSIARAVQGLGGGGLVSLGQTVISEIVPPRERGYYQVYISSVFIGSSLAGPVLGGVFAEHWHWSAIFWMNVPLGLIAFLLASSQLRKLPRYGRYRSFDSAGAFFLLAATVTLLLALSWGGRAHPWMSPVILGLLAASFSFWLLFVLRMHAASEPLLPLKLLLNNVVFYATLARASCTGIFTGLAIYMPVYLQSVAGMNPSRSGLAMVPFMAGLIAGSTIAGRLLTKVHRYKRVALYGLSAAFITAWIFAIIPPGLPLAWIEALLLLLSLGLGTVLNVAIVAAQNAMPLHQLGIGTAGMNLFRQLSGAILVAVFGAIVLGGGGGADLHGAAPSDNLTPPPEAYRQIFFIAAAGMAAAFVALLLMEERPLLATRPLSSTERQ
jgi:EmrB/QacA subfamily drug resistance transporter